MTNSKGKEYFKNIFKRTYVYTNMKKDFEKSLLLAKKNLLL